MIKPRNDPHPAIARFAKGAFAHLFGGRPRHRGVAPKGSKVSMHLLLSLDLSDPLVPIDSAGGAVALPLYYPLRYAMGGGEVQYDVVSDGEIKILSALEKEEVDGGEDLPFPDHFPEHSITLVPLTYPQNRAIAAAERGSNHYSEDPEAKEDLRILKELGYWRMIRLGAGFSPPQGGIRWTCSNRACDSHGKNVRLDVFASLTNTVAEGISIFGDLADAEVYFGLTACCKTVVSVNRCT